MPARIKNLSFFFVQCWRSIPLTTWLIVLGLSLFFWFWIFGNQGLYEMEELRSVKAELFLEKEKLAKERETLERELKNLKDPRYQKHLIHKELGFVEEGEVMIQFQKDKN